MAPLFVFSAREEIISAPSDKPALIMRKAIVRF
jgi:hypothetical protein